VLTEYHRYWSAARARLAGSRAAGVGSPALAARLLAMAAHYAGEVRILRFAICDELQRQSPASPARLRRSPHDGRDAIHKKALVGPGTALHKSRLLANCPDFGAGSLAWGRLHGDRRTQTEALPSLVIILRKPMALMGAPRSLKNR
jgi:hypothetical protein